MDYSTDPQILLRRYLAGTCTTNELQEVLHYVTTPEGKAMLEDLLRDQERQTNVKPSPLVSRRLYRRIQQSIQRSYVARVAATVTLIAIVTLLGWWYTQPLVYTTAYGEQRTVVLPDSSVVLLNANSRLEVPRHWEEMRDVSLWGEAFFTVKKLAHSTEPHYVKFIVHAGALDVEVTGTEFNVRQRTEQTSVVLKTGQVRLNVVPTADTLTMRPGEMVTHRPQTRTLKKQYVKPDLYLGWTQHILRFEGASLTDIAHVIEETFGYTVIIEQEALRDRRFQGSVPSSDLDILLVGLEEALSLDVVRSEDKIIIREP